MAVKLSVWSLALTPGEKYPIYIRRDFQLTNASLGEQLVSDSGRSVIKVTHDPLPANFYDSDSDSEIDREDEDEQDEFELDEEEGFKKVTGDSTTAAEKMMANDEDDEDAEEDEDFEGMDEDDSDSDDEDMGEGTLETSVVCALTAGRIEQATLNLTFTKGDVVMFEVTGENDVHLMGNYIDQFPDEDEDDSDFDDEHDDYSDLYDDEDLELENDEPLVGRITEVDEAPITKKADKPKSKSATPAASATIKAEPKATASAATNGNKRKADAIESPAAKPAAAASTDALSKNQKKKLKKVKTEGGEAAPAAAADKKPEVKKEAQGGKGQKVRK